MTDEEIKVVVGGLLHDIGKVIYRKGDDQRKHSESGHDFLKDEAGINDRDILDAVRFHHADAIKTARISNDSLAYIIYIADNIASAADRRQNEAQDIGFEKSMPLQSVFNILNGNKQNLYYEPKTLDDKDDINYPSEKKIPFDDIFYSKIKASILDNLRGIEISDEYLNSLLEITEANLTYVPSSTAKHEMADISLFDHMKLTAAIASCIYEYCIENSISDYRQELFINSKTFYDAKTFLLYSMDVSGIQDFIYTITSKNAMKTLRAKSFYLEIMMEHIIDCLLQKLDISRANLIYSGGGHCYILLPNTEKTKKILEDNNREINDWLMKVFSTALYVADGFEECSTNDLKNMPNGSYSMVFRNVSNSISQKKSRRYSANDIRKINSKEYDDYTRECKVCKRIGKVDDDGVCPICRAIENFSKNILQSEFFTVSLREKENALPLPGGYFLYPDSENSLKTKMQQDDYFVRAYSKNKLCTGKNIATKLWVGNYSTGKEFKVMAEEAEGVDRIGVLRADVDNLGQAFVCGFENKENDNRYVTLSRTATLSRQLSLFFKLHINKILKKKERNATICYSGGDDLFIVGAWNEVIELAVDISNEFKKYTQGTLTLSAGIGVYQDSYPISVIAQEVAEMEDASKKLPGKNAVTLFEDGCRHEYDCQGNILNINDGTYKWDEFENEVLGEKYKVIEKFFSVSDERGFNYLYNLLELVRSQNDKINFARFVYILSRLEPDIKADAIQKENYSEFSKNMIKWIRNESDCRQLKTAINMYVYMNREKDGYADEY